MHSHDYRQPDRHKDEIVLIIGAGPSGIDIAIEIATEAKQVIWSNHNSLCNFTLPANVKNVGDVKCFDTHSVQLMSGDEEQITCVLFCTGNISLPLKRISQQFLTWPFIVVSTRLHKFISIPLD